MRVIAIAAAMLIGCYQAHNQEPDAGAELEGARRCCERAGQVYVWHPVSSPEPMNCEWVCPGDGCGL